LKLLSSDLLIQVYVAPGQLSNKLVWCLRKLLQNRQPSTAISRSFKKRKDYAFRRQFDEKPIIIPGCPEADSST